MKYLPLIWAALTRHKTRTVLTVLTVAAAFVLFGLIGLVNHAMTHAADSVASAHRLITFAQPSRSSGLPVSLEAQIRGVPGVQAVTFNHPFWGVYQNPNNLVGGFAIPNNYFDLFPKYHCPAPGWRKFYDTRTGAVVGAKLAAEYHWKVGEQIPVEASGYVRRDGSDTWTFDVVCIDHAQPRNLQNAIFFHWNYFALSLAQRNVGAGAFFEKIANALNAGEIAAAVDSLTENSDHPTKTESANAMIADKLRQAIDLRLVARALMTAVFFTLLMITGSAVSQSVTDRMPEFAVLKAFGFRRIVLIAIIVTETALLYVFGGILGLAVASIAGAEVLHVFRGFIDPLVGSPGQMQNAGLWLRGIGLMVLFSAVVGMLAAGRVARQRIVDAFAEQ